MLKIYEKLLKTEESLTNEFVKEAVIAQVSEKLCSAVSSGLINSESLLIIALYLARFDPTRFGQIQGHFKAIIPNLNFEQVRIRKLYFYLIYAQIKSVGFFLEIYI